MIAAITQLLRKRAGVLSTLALLLGAIVLQGCATLNENSTVGALDAQADYSIFMARIDQMKFTGSPECPDGYICMNSLYDLRLTPVEYIAGNPNVGARTYAISQHSAYRRGILLAVHAKRDSKGEWALVDRSLIRVETCLSDEAVESVEVLKPSTSNWDAVEDEEAEQVCFNRILLPSDD